MLDRLEFLISEALVALRRNSLMTFAAVTTVAISLFLIGGLGAAYMTLNDFAGRLSGRFEMRVMVREGTTQAQISEVAKRLRALEGVKSASWIPRDKEWERYRTKIDSEGVFEDIENPIPDSFKIEFTELKLADDVVDRIKAFSEVTDVQYLREETQLIVDMLAFLRLVGFWVGGLLFVCGGVLIYNAIRLTIVSRRLEIRIMQLVGASWLTVRVPFYVEGIVQGFLGGLLATLLLNLAYLFLRDSWSFLQRLVEQGQLGAAQPPFPFVYVASMLCLLGAAYGLVCSMLAVRAPLRYR